MALTLALYRYSPCIARNIKLQVDKKGMALQAISSIEPRNLKVVFVVTYRKIKLKKKLI